MTIRVRLGEVCCPSGQLVIVDGERLTDRGLAVDGLPTDRPLWLERAPGRRCGLVLSAASAAVAVSRAVAAVPLSGSVLVLADAYGLRTWDRDEPVDGLADVVFWGRSQAQAARVFDASMLVTGGDLGYGWADLGVDDAGARTDAVLDWLDADPGRELTVRLRPHSRHWLALREMVRSPSGACTVAGGRILFVHVGRGDDHLLVQADRAASGDLGIVRIDAGHRD
jgi:hypothetical protein